MHSARVPNFIFSILVVIGAVQIFFRAAQLPPALASHFGIGGRADGWQSRIAFLCTEIALFALTAVVAYGLPRALAAVPASMVNLPNRDWWLAPERREQTWDYLRIRFIWFGCALLAFVLFVMDLVIRANFRNPPQLDTVSLAAALILFLAFTASWVIRLIFHFSRPSRGATRP